MSVPHDAPGFIYIMESGGFHKIGWSQRPPTRLKHIQSANPVPVTLVGVIEGSLVNEGEWHQAFAHKRVRGEWFSLTEEDISHVLHESFGIDNIPDERWDGIDDPGGDDFEAA